MEDILLDEEEDDERSLWTAALNMILLGLVYWGVGGRGYVGTDRV